MTGESDDQAFKLDETNLSSVDGTQADPDEIDEWWPLPRGIESEAKAIRREWSPQECEGRATHRVWLLASSAAPQGASNEKWTAEALAEIESHMLAAGHVVSRIRPRAWEGVGQFEKFWELVERSLGIHATTVFELGRFADRRDRALRLELQGQTPDHGGAGR